MKKMLIPSLALSALALVACGNQDPPAADPASVGSVPGGTFSTPSDDAPVDADNPSETTGDTDTSTEAAETEPETEPEPEPETESAALPDGLYPRDEMEVSTGGYPVDFGEISVSADTRQVIVENGGRGASVDLPTEAESAVVATPLHFEDSYALGVLVQQSAGEFFDLSLALIDDGQVTLATEPADVPFGAAYDEGTGTIYDTWTTDSGAHLWTRVRVEGSPENIEQYTVYSWNVIDGALVPTEVGVGCFDDDAETYEAC